jgi:large subunit ribosomal protein L18
MENRLEKRTHKRIMRALRVRKHLRGTAEKPRLSVAKTNKHISVQLIDDEKGITLASVSTLNENMGKKNKATAKQIGLKLGQLAKEKQVERVVFDRGRFKYHGIIEEVATGAREAGLQF